MMIILNFLFAAAVDPLYLVKKKKKKKSLFLWFNRESWLNYRTAFEHSEWKIMN